MKSVEIDSNAGFCGGVIRTIGTAEKYLASRKGSHLYSLGEIVHNESEIARLSALGLVALDVEDLDEISRLFKLLGHSHQGPRPAACYL